MPHLRRGFIAPKVGHRAKHDPFSSPSEPGYPDWSKFVQKIVTVTRPALVFRSPHKTPCDWVAVHVLQLFHSFVVSELSVSKRLTQRPSGKSGTTTPKESSPQEEAAACGEIHSHSGLEDYNVKKTADSAVVLRFAETPLVVSVSDKSEIFVESTVTCCDYCSWAWWLKCETLADRSISGRGAVTLVEV